MAASTSYFVVGNIIMFCTEYFWALFRKGTYSSLDSSAIIFLRVGLLLHQA